MKPTLAALSGKLQLLRHSPRMQRLVRRSALVVGLVVLMTGCRECGL
jgi:hypothetical protein